MAEPTPYTVTFDFSGWQATNPADPLPGVSLDGELYNIATSIGEIITSLQDVRRSDGKLRNESVSIESLSPEVASRFEGSSAYAIAVENGFEGTEEEWLASLEGPAATVTVGSVTTGAPGTEATVTNVGTTSAAVLDFVLPRGNPGADGDGSGDMTAATYDPTGKAADVFDVDNHVDGTVNKVFTAAEQSKLAGVAEAATANSADATLLARANHTGTQLAATISDFSTAADARVAAAIGVSVQGYDAETLKGDTDARLTAGYIATTIDDGTKSSGTYLPTPAGGNMRFVINGGSHTLAAPTLAGDYTIVILYSNSASAGTVSMTGFTKVTGDAFTASVGHVFMVYITKMLGVTHAHVVAF